MKRTLDDFGLQGEEILSLRSQIELNRMVHAVLITGEQGLGKRTLATLLAAALLCRREGKKPCGECRDCLQAENLQHPDLISVEKKRSSISVDEIREVIRKCGETSFEGGNRVVLIAEAGDMTPSAQNSLLKILEEPQDGTYFILTSSHPEQLLITVKSRCRLVRMKPWPLDYVEKTLTEAGIDAELARQAARDAGGSIGVAMTLAGDSAYWETRREILQTFLEPKGRSGVLAFSTAWKERKQEAETLFAILERCVAGMLRGRLDGGVPGKTEAPEKNGENLPPAWQRFAREAGPERFAFLLDAIGEARKKTAANVNFQAVIEQLLLCFIGEGEVWAK